MSEKRFVAVHEAGHVVASVALGVPARAAFIDGSMQPSRDKVVDGWTAHDLSSPFNEAVIAMAGAAAVRLAFPERAAEAVWCDDMWEVERLLPAIPLEEQRRIGPTVFALLQDNWAAVERVAAALEERGHLDRFEIDELTEGT